MKKLNQLILVAILIFANSCSRYIDGHYNLNDKMITKDFEFKFLKNENTFIYFSQLNEKRDNEIILNTKFELSLPKNIKSFKINNISDFIFHYSGNQSFIIHLDNEKRKNLQSDSLYVPSFKDLDVFVEEHCAGIEKNKFKKTGRAFYFFKRKNATILLYNIKSDNADVFINCAKSLSFL